MTQPVYRQRIHFGGRVQGVGFRYNTLQTAKEYAVCGFIRNVPDGRVQLVAEGDEREVKAFSAMVAERLSPFIRETTIEEEREANAKYNGFIIGS